MRYIPLEVLKNAQKRHNAMKDIQTKVRAIEKRALENKRKLSRGDEAEEFVWPMGHTRFSLRFYIGANDEETSVAERMRQYVVAYYDVGWQKTEDGGRLMFRRTSNRCIMMPQNYREPERQSIEFKVMNEDGTVQDLDITHLGKTPKMTADEAKNFVMTMARMKNPDVGHSCTTTTMPNGDKVISFNTHTRRVNDVTDEEMQNTFFNQLH